MHAQPADVNPAELSAILRGEWQAQRETAQAAYAANAHAFRYLKQLTQIADGIIRHAWEALHRPLDTPSWRGYCLLATGGYGRQELYPHSDIDLLLLYEDDDCDARDAAQAFAAGLFPCLWDTGLRLGHACRSIGDTLHLAQADHTVMTALIDARLLCGDPAPWQRFRRLRAARGEEARARFAQDKLAERQARLDKHGHSRFLLEPNIKENAGGLRDLHVLYWLAREYYGVRRVSELVKLGRLSAREYRHFTRCHRFLATLRIHLHLLAGRAEERLSFEHQPDIAARLGYRHHEQHRPVERFMKRYFQTAREVGTLTRLFCALIEQEQDNTADTPQPASHPAFVIRGHRLDFAAGADPSARPLLLLELFAAAQEELLHIHPHAWQAVTRNLHRIDRRFREDTRTGALFMQMLLSPNAPDLTLTRLNEAGVLGRLLPDFAYIIGQIQYDRYHVYTVDEHTIRLIGHLNAIERGNAQDDLPLASELIHRIHARGALFLAALCHDIAKGRGGQHEKRGIRLTCKIGRQLGLDAAMIDTACWLVAHHLLFSQTAFSRDLDDPQTLIDFVQAVQSPERLRLLLLLSVADIRAVGPGIWNGWKGALLRDLYHRAEAEMGMPLFVSREARIARARARLAADLSGWPQTLRERLLGEPSAAFWYGMPEEYHGLLAPLIRRLWEGETDIACDYSIHLFESVTHLWLCLADTPGLLHRVAGCVTLTGGDIVAIKSVSLRGGLAVMLLDLQDRTHRAFEDRAALNALPERLRRALQDPAWLEPQIARRRRTRSAGRAKALQVTPAVFIDNGLSAVHSVIEINAADRPGLLYDVTAAMARLGLGIHSSQIATYGDKAVDVFYVSDKTGVKIAETALAAIRDTLLSVLQQGVTPGHADDKET